MTISPSPIYLGIPDNLYLPVLNNTRIKKVFMQMIHILQHTLLPTHNDIVNRAQMLRVLGQSHATRVRHNRDVEFGSHEQDGNDFVDAAETARVDLADVDGPGGEELLEHDAVLAHFAGGDADIVGLEGVVDGFVAEDWGWVLANASFLTMKKRLDGRDV